MTTLPTIPNSRVASISPDGVELKMITGPDVFQPLLSTSPAWVVYRDYLAGFESTAGLKVADFGAGTGQFAVWTKQAFPDVDVHAYDVDPNTEKYMEANAAMYEVDINIHIEDVADISSTEKFDSIIASPPFYPTLVKRLNPEEEHAKDPEIAVYGGSDGLDVLKVFVSKAQEVLKSNGVLVLVHSTPQSQKVQTILTDSGFSVIKSTVIVSEKDLYVLVPSVTYAVKN